MDGNAIPVNENQTVIVKSSGDLFLRGEEQAEIRFLSSEDRIKVNQSAENVYVETHSSIDLSVPRRANVIIERVGGSAFLQDLEGTLTIQKVGGDLALQRLGTVRLEKVGGSCLVDDIRGGLTLYKVGGDFTARKLNGLAEIGSVGGTLDIELGPASVIEGRSGGDSRIYLTAQPGERLAVKAGGDVQLFLSSEVTGSFTLVSNSEDIVLRLVNREEKVDRSFETRKHEFVLGSGGAQFEAVAGGQVLVSDEERTPEPITEELERRESAWKEARERHGHPSWSGGFGFDRSSAWADMISRRAQEAARRAEQRSQAALRRTEEQIRRAAEREMRRAETNFGSGWPMPPVPPVAPVPPRQAAEPVTPKERMMILQMLQEQKITAEQAEMLLAALEGRSKD